MWDPLSKYDAAMLAFVTPLGLFNRVSHRNVRIGSGHRIDRVFVKRARPTRRARVTLIATETTLDTSTSEIDVVSELKHRSVIALRGLSDLSGVILLHELSQRIITCGSPSVALVADAELLFGTLMGMWTAAVFAERLRKTQSKLIQQSRELPAKWDDTILYTPAIEADDIPSAVAWLCAFDELEGLGAADMLRPFAFSPDPMIRLRLAQAFRPFPLRSNICLAILTTLAQDHNRWVRCAAKESLASYEAAGIIERLDDPEHGVTLLREKDSDGKTRDFADEVGLRAILERMLRDPKAVALPAVLVADLPSPLWRRETRWLRQVVAKQVGHMRNAALSQPDLGDWSRYAPGLLLQAEGGTTQAVASSTARRPRYGRNDMEHLLQAVENGVGTGDPLMSEFDLSLLDVESEDWDDSYLASDINNLKSAKVTPLVDCLGWSEIHGICALALVPACYGLFSVVDGVGLPLRFVGLGWLLALGGFAAYPQSAKLWSSLRHTIERLPRADPKV